MAMNKAQTHSSATERGNIRAVERAIDLLQALNQQPVSSIHSLHRSTGLPKSTLSRLLRTLEAKGLVSHLGQYGAYMVTSKVASLSCGYHDAPSIIEAAAAIAEALTREVKWPLALALLDTDAVVVRYSTIPHSPLSLLHSTLNKRYSLVARALGRAYLAFCSPEEQELLLEVVRQSGLEEDGLAHQGKALRAMLAETRSRGYALRDPAVRPVSSSIAVPIFDQERVVGSLGMTWFSSVLTPAQVLERYLVKLQDASRQISARLVELNCSATSGRPTQP